MTQIMTRVKVIKLDSPSSVASDAMVKVSAICERLWHEQEKELQGHSSHLSRYVLGIVASGQNLPRSGLSASHMLRD
jgi:hypothetical protein